MSPDKEEGKIVVVTTIEISPTLQKCFRIITCRLAVRKGTREDQATHLPHSKSKYQWVFKTNCNIRNLPSQAKQLFKPSKITMSTTMGRSGGEQPKEHLLNLLTMTIKIAKCSRVRMGL